MNTESNSRKTIADRLADVLHFFLGHHWKRARGYEAHDRDRVVATWECEWCGDVEVTAGEKP